jgi:hypothetical protein
MNNIEQQQATTLAIEGLLNDIYQEDFQTDNLLSANTSTQQGGNQAREKQVVPPLHDTPRKTHQDSASDEEKQNLHEHSLFSHYEIASLHSPYHEVYNDATETSSQETSLHQVHHQEYYFLKYCS